MHELKANLNARTRERASADIIYNIRYDIIYNITLFATLFTVFTGLTYIYSNRNTLKGFIQDEQ